MASIDKLVIEISGDATSFTKALSQAQKNLTAFNASVASGSKAIDSFISTVNKGASSAERLTASINNIKSSFTALNSTITKSAGSVERFGASARLANADIQSFSRNLAKTAASFEAISGASKGAISAINSLQTRVRALGASVSMSNAEMRNFGKTVAIATEGAKAGGIIVNNYGNQVEETGRKSRGTMSAFGSLNKANLSLMEGFRRQVAQITALRTLVYQAAFWFGPLIYSIIKTNAEYENQMALLKNLSNLGTEAARSQWAEQTRLSLVALAQTNPFSLHAITDTFVQMKTVGLDPLNGELQTVMDSLAAFGKGDQGLRSVGLALQEMVGKTAVSMKELRRQLGQQIPDAMRAMADGMHMSMSDFYKAVQHGTVESKEAIRKMLAELNFWHRGAAENMMMTWSGLFARLTTTWQNFVAELEHPNGANPETSFIGQMKKNINDLMAFMNSPGGVNFAIQVNNALATVASSIASVVKFVVEWKDQIIEAAKIFAIMWGGRLVLGTLSSVISVFTGGFRLIVMAIRVFTTASETATAVTTVFSAEMRALAVSMGLAATEAEAASVGLGVIAGTMGIALGAAIALAAGIYLVVRALNAETDAQKNANLAKNAAAGKTWDSGDQQQSEKQRLLNLKDRAQAGGQYVQTGEGTPVWVADSPKAIANNWAEYNKGAHAFNLTNSNTKNATKNMVDVQFQQAQASPYAAINEKYTKLEGANGVTATQTDALEQKRQAELTKAAHDSYASYYKQWEKEKDPAQKARLQQMLDVRKADYQSYVEGSKAYAEPNAFVADKKKKGKKPKKGPSFEGIDNRYAQAYVGTQDLQHQYDDLVNGTSTEFDSEAARKVGEEKAKALGKNKEAIRDAIQREKDYQAELKKSIQVEQAIVSIKDKRHQEEAQLKTDLGDLTTGYKAITDETNRYRVAIEDEFHKQLQIAEGRMKSGKATEEQILQYKRLREAIDATVRAKQADLVVNAAKEAKTANETYYSTLRSGSEQDNYTANIDKAKYNDALTNALDIINRNKDADRDLAAAQDALAEAQTRVAATTSDQNKIDGDAIVITARRRVDTDLETEAAKKSLPFLQERLRILDEEASVRDKWGGAGKPLFDWAVKANNDFKDLGATMGTTLTGAMDDFINSLADGKMAFADFAKTVLKQLLLIIIRGLIAKAIMSALGLSGSFKTGDTVSQWSTSNISANPSAFGISHAGGIAGGTPGRVRSGVDPSIFNFAQRYHTGGIVGIGSNEIPIIAERGEGVFTKEQMQALGNGTNGSNVQVNVINQTGVEADVKRAEPKFDGEKWVETIILKKMTQPGPVRDGLASFTKR